jgi:phosphotransferase system HPr (HPr) family protein
MVIKEFTVKAVNGLNSKAAGALVAQANQYECNLTLKYRHEIADLKSIMNVMGLVIRKGEAFSISADGKDEQAALDAMTALAQSIHLV